MEIKEKRRNRNQVSIDQRLINDGAAQLASEIEILENWLNELEKTDGTFPGVADARIAYKDMLRSRKEMYQALMDLSKSRSDT